MFSRVRFRLSEDIDAVPPVRITVPAMEASPRFSAGSYTEPTPIWATALTWGSSWSSSRNTTMPLSSDRRRGSGVSKSGSDGYVRSRTS